MTAFAGPSIAVSSTEDVTALGDALAAAERALEEEAASLATRLPGDALSVLQRKAESRHEELRRQGRIGSGGGGADSESDGGDMPKVEVTPSMLAVELCREFSDRLLRVLDSGAGAAAIMRAFDSALPAAVAALPLADRFFSRDAVRDAVARGDGVQPFLVSPEGALRQLVDDAVGLFAEPAEACLEAVHAAVAAAFGALGAGGNTSSGAASARQGAEVAGGGGGAGSALDEDAVGSGVLRRYPHAHARLSAAALASLDEHKARASKMLHAMIAAHRKYPTPRFFRTRPLQVTSAAERRLLARGANGELRRSQSSRLSVDADADSDDDGSARSGARRTASTSYDDDVLAGLSVEEDEAAFEDTTKRELARRATMAGSQLAGYLSKHTEKESALVSRESWQRRYFVLDEQRRTLWYFSDQRATAVRGEIDMSQVVVTDMAESEESRQAYAGTECMVALSPKDEYATVGGRHSRVILRAESAQQKREWLTRLGAVGVDLNPAAARVGSAGEESAAGAVGGAEGESGDEDQRAADAQAYAQSRGWAMPSNMGAAEREEFMYGSHAESLYGGEVIDHVAETGRAYMDHTATVLLHSIPKVIVFFMLEPVKTELMSRLFKEMCKATDERVAGEGGVGERSALESWAKESPGWDARREQVAAALPPLRAARTAARALFAHAREREEKSVFGDAFKRGGLGGGRGDENGVAFTRRESARLEDAAREERMGIVTGANKGAPARSSGAAANDKLGVTSAGPEQPPMRVPPAPMPATKMRTPGAARSAAPAPIGRTHPSAAPPAAAPAPAAAAASVPVASGARRAGATGSAPKPAGSAWGGGHAIDDIFGPQVGASESALAPAPVPARRAANNPVVNAAQKQPPLAATRAPVTEQPLAAMRPASTQRPGQQPVSSLPPQSRPQPPAAAVGAGGGAPPMGAPMGGPSMASAAKKKVPSSARGGVPAPASNRPSRPVPQRSAPRPAPAKPRAPPPKPPPQDSLI